MEFLQHIGRRSGQNFQYPVTLRQRPAGIGEAGRDTSPATFDQSDYTAINQARLAHLESLQLVLQGKTVLDVGCGVGHLAQFFVNKGCNVVCIDGREENIVSLRSRFPNLTAHVANVEIEPLSKFGSFEIVFCYGLLYHLENPVIALRNMASVCQGLLLLETVVCDHNLPVMRLEDESAAFSQSMSGLGCRPSPAYVVMATNRAGFDYVYAPRTPPEHQDFRFTWKRNLDWRRDGHLLRCIFVASRTSLHNPNLVNLLGD